MIFLRILYKLRGGFILSIPSLFCCFSVWSVMKNFAWFCCVVSLSFLSACSHQSTSVPLPNSITHLESVSKDSADQIVIPYQKYRLANGLTVILHEDHSDPLVHVDVTYHVGSAREEVGKTGFAHFFEHMMFQGSKHIADEEHFKLINSVGGEMNGTTNTDRTNYYQTVPANQLERVLWLESDRMGFLLDAVTQEKFEVQRETVKNERAQRYDNAPYGLLRERVAEALYPNGHPYSWQTIGYIEDLNRVGVNELKQFFKRWYGPNNATITIGGDIDVNQTLAWLDKYFGPIPAGPEVKPASKTLVTLPETRFISMEDNVSDPLIYIAYPTVYGFHDDEPALDVLSNLFSHVQSSLAYKELIKTGKALNVSASHPCQELACSFYIYALPNPNHNPSLSYLYDEINQLFAEFEKRGVKQEDIDKIKSNWESHSILGLQSVSGKVSALANYETLFGNANLTQPELDRYAKVTPEDVMRVYKKYIKDKAHVVMSVVPKGQLALRASEQEYVYPGRNLPEQITETQPMPTVIADITPETFDRTVMPPAGKPIKAYLPEIWSRDIAPTLKVYGATNDEVPVTTVVVTMEGGPLLDPEGKYGLASITASLMNDSSRAYSVEEASYLLEKYGSSIDFSASGRYLTATITSLTKHLDDTLLIFADKLLHPQFTEQEFMITKQQILRGIKQGESDAGTLAARASKRILFGEHSRVGFDSQGTFESVSNIQLQDVKSFYESYVSRHHLQAFVVGDLTPKQYRHKLNFLKQLPNTAYQVPELTLPEWREQPRIYIIDKPNSPQSVVRFIKPAKTYDYNGEQFRSMIMNYPFGGNFNSRLNMSLREDKGYTYGVSSGFYGGKSTGQFLISTSVKADSTGAAIVDIVSLLGTYQADGMTEDELATTRSAFTESDALSFETSSQKASYIQRKVSYELPDDYIDQQNAIIRKISAQELRQLSKQLMDVDSMDIVIAGNAELIKQQLQSIQISGKPRQIIEL